MSKLSNANITNTEISAEYGFSWIEFNVAGVDYTLQACLDDGESVDWSDHGMNDGLSFDANEKAFNEFGQSESIKFLEQNAY